MVALPYCMGSRLNGWITDLHVQLEYKYNLACRTEYFMEGKKRDFSSQSLLVLDMVLKGDVGVRVGVCSLTLDSF